MSYIHKFPSYKDMIPCPQCLIPFCKYVYSMFQISPPAPLPPFDAALMVQGRGSGWGIPWSGWSRGSAPTSSEWRRKTWPTPFRWATLLCFYIFNTMPSSGSALSIKDQVAADEWTPALFSETMAGAPTTTTVRCLYWHGRYIATAAPAGCSI